MEINDLEIFNKKMVGAIEVLKSEFVGLRTGRASVNILDPIKVYVYGNVSPIEQVAGISVQDARSIVVKAWDKNLIKSIEKAIRESNLGLNPSIDGDVIRIQIPQLSEERRNELSKIAAKYSEESRIAIRNIRRDAMDAIKKAEKNKKITEDIVKKFSDVVQKFTDLNVKEIDDLLLKKQKEIMTV